MRLKRLITSVKGTKRGPLFICLGGVHGNEPAATKAIKMVAKMLKVEPITNPNFQYSGKFIGIRGNLKAIKKKVRFIDKDLNRSFTRENIEKIKSGDYSGFDNEDRQVYKIVRKINKQIKKYKPEKLFVIDLHTTTASGGIFTLVAEDDPESLKLALEIHAPVITGMTKGIKGTTIDFFQADQFGVDTTCVAFEAGQHLDPLSVNRSVAAIINCMRSIGAIDGAVVENQHNYLLKSYSAGLPKLSELKYCYQFKPNDKFIMKAGYKNFDPVKKGEILADDKNGPIVCKEDGYILMPKYQAQGNDGFFIIRPLEFSSNQ